MDEKVKKYFNNELFILKNVNHPNIVKLYDIKQTLNNFYLVFDLCNGGGLSNCLERYKKKHDGKPFPENIVQHLMKQIVSGMKYLHNKKILHRDIKLDNILVKFETDEDKDNDNYFKALKNSYTSEANNLNNSYPLYCAMRKYGLENFSFEVLEEC